MKHENDVVDAVDFMKPSYAEGKHKAIQAEVDEVYRKAEAFNAIAINIKALRKHMLNSDNSVNAKRMETLNTLKHTEEIIKTVPCNDE